MMHGTMPKQGENMDLKKYLDQNKMSQREFADRLGCTEASVSRYISGQRVPKAPLAIKMAEILGTTVEELFADDIKEAPKE